MFGFVSVIAITRCVCEIGLSFICSIFSDDCRASEFKKCYYHADTGLIHRLQGEGLTITAANNITTSTYTTGDIVGCGIDYVSQEFFFTYVSNTT